MFIPCHLYADLKVKTSFSMFITRHQVWSLVSKYSWILCESKCTSCFSYYMKYCILVVKIVEDYIISGFLPNIDIPCALTIRSYFLQSKVVLFLFLVVFPFLFWLGVF